MPSLFSNLFIIIPLNNLLTSSRHELWTYTISFFIIKYIDLGLYRIVSYFQPICGDKRSSGHFPRLRFGRSACVHFHALGRVHSNERGRLVRPVSERRRGGHSSLREGTLQAIYASRVRALEWGESKNVTCSFNRVLISVFRECRNNNLLNA